MRIPRRAPLALLLALALVATVGLAVGSGQQTVPFQGGIPVAPTGLANRPLPDKPMEFDTGEGQRIRVVVMTKGLKFPWALAFLPAPSTPLGAGGPTMLITERTGHLRIIRNGVLDPNPVPGGPTGYFAGESGLPGAVHGYMDIALHPKFAENRLLYLSYTKPLDEKRRTVGIARARFDGKSLIDVKDIFVLDAAGTTRIAFGKDGMLYVTTTGGTSKDPNFPQDPGDQGGKVLRIRDDGSIPPDNPFAGKAVAKPEVYTLGHRSSLGLRMYLVTGEMWLNENGPYGGDEINILKAGANYGWPKVSYGRTYPGPWQSEVPGHAGFEPPVVYWVPSIAVSGMEFYTGDKFPKWKGDVFVGSLRTGEIPGTGHLERILFNEKMQELRRESLLTELHQRIRDVRQGPDGLLYLITDSDPGAVLRIEPVAARTTSSK